MQKYFQLVNRTRVQMNNGRSNVLSFVLYCSMVAGGYSSIITGVPVFPLRVRRPRFVEKLTLLLVVDSFMFKNSIVLFLIPCMSTTTHGCDYEGSCKISTVLFH